MPMIDLTVTKGAIRAEAAEALADRLSEILLKWEGAPDNAVSRSITWAFVHVAEAVRVGARPAEAPRWRVEATVPQGAMKDAAKAGFVKEATAAVLAAEGLAPDKADPMRVWCFIREVPDGHWGGGGKIFRLRRIAALVRRGNGPSVGTG